MPLCATDGMGMDRTTSVPKSVLFYVVDKVGSPGNQPFPILFSQIKLEVAIELNVYWIVDYKRNMFYSLLL